MCKGFIRIPCRLLETKWWNQKQVLSENEAVVNLYQRADRQGIINSSIRSLAREWGWEQTKVLRFLTKLEKDKFISSTKLRNGTVIKILDFGEDATPTAISSATPTATPNTLNTKDLDTDGATPTATPSATPTATPSRAYKNDNIIKSCLIEEDKERDSSLRSESLSSDDDDAISKAHDVGEELSKFFNQLVAEQSSVMPKVRAVGGDRRKMLMARVKQYGVEAVKEAFVKATTSSFLNGQNGRGFTASFDWIIRPNNFLKVLEGNYDNKNNSNTHHATTQTTQQPYHDSDHPTTEQLRQQTAAYIASRLAQD